jgi:hypothetical protein
VRKPIVNAALKRRPREPVPGRGSVLVAVVATLVAAGAILVSLYSLNVARDAKSSAAAAASDAERLASGRPSLVPAPAATAAVTPTPSPTPVYLPELRAVDVTTPAAEGCQSLFIDVDTAQVGVYSGHDFYFSACGGPLAVHFDNVESAGATGGNTTPEGCAARLTGVSPSPELQLPVTAGMTFCLLTSKAAAARAGIPQHMAVVQVRQITSDRAVSVTLDTYRVSA